MAEENKSSLDPLAALCKRRGFIYHSSEIYGGMPGFWDYGPLGCELKQNVKQAWWQFTVRGRSDVVGLDATIIMHPRIWKASGHLDTFADPMTMCKQCITVDPESPKDGKFTVRDRDTMQQERMPLDEFLVKMYGALEF